MEKQERRRWAGLIAALTAAGGPALRLCAAFRGFEAAYTAPAILAGICLAAGAAALVLAVREKLPAAGPDEKKP